MRFCTRVLAAISVISTAQLASASNQHDFVSGNNGVYEQSNDSFVQHTAALRGTKRENELPGWLGEETTYGKNELVLHDESNLRGNGIDDHMSNRRSLRLSEKNVDNFRFVGNGWCKDGDGQNYHSGQITYPSSKAQNFQACAKSCPTSNLVGVEDRDGYCMCLYEKGGLPPSSKFSKQKVFTTGSGTGVVVNAEKGNDRESKCYSYLDFECNTGVAANLLPEYCPNYSPLPDLVRKVPPTGYVDGGQGECRDFRGRTYASGTLTYGTQTSLYRTFQMAAVACPRGNRGDLPVGVQDHVDNSGEKSVQCLYEVGQRPGSNLFTDQQRGTGGSSDGMAGDGTNLQFYCYPASDPCESCPLINDPVCGDDGVTYANECVATCAGKRVVSQGECKISRKTLVGYQDRGQGECRDQSNREYQSGTIPYGLPGAPAFFSLAVAQCPTSGLMGVQDGKDSFGANTVQCLYERGVPIPSPWTFSTTNRGTGGSGRPTSGNGNSQFYCYAKDSTGAVRKTPNPPGFQSLAQGQCVGWNDRSYRAGTIPYGPLEFHATFYDAVKFCPVTAGLVGVEDHVDNFGQTSVKCLYDDGQPLPSWSDSFTSDNFQSRDIKGMGRPTSTNGDTQYFCYTRTGANGVPTPRSGY